MFNLDRISAVIFDLDDTLVNTALDFAAIKQAIGCPSSHDILSFADALPTAEKREKAHQIILQHELDDAASSVWIDGAEEFVLSVQAAKLPSAIVTRNCRRATALKLKNNNIDIDTVITREDAPPKPDPTALLRIADSWSLAPAEIAYIGDYKYDIFAAHNAEMQAWLYTKPTTPRQYAKCLQRIHKNNPLFQQENAKT
nr:HAD-IA family hydrolase [Glaciecola sp. MH2013]